MLACFIWHPPPVGVDSADKSGSDLQSAGLSDVIAVLNGMMEAFQKMVTEDNTNWANYEKLNDGQQADKTAFVQGMKSQVYVFSKLYSKF